MKKILALTFGTLLLNIGSAQSINCTQSVANGTTYNSCNFGGIQGNNNTTTQGTGNVLGFTGTRGDSVQPQSLASMEADDAARAARVAAMRTQMAQAPSQGLTPYQAQLVAKIRATAVPTAPVDPYSQGTGNVLGFTGTRGDSVQPQSLASMEADDAARAARVAAMRAQMAQPQATTNNTAQGASNSKEQATLELEMFLALLV